MVERQVTHAFKEIDTAIRNSFKLIPTPPAAVVWTVGIPPPRTTFVELHYVSKQPNNLVFDQDNTASPHNQSRSHTSLMVAVQLSTNNSLHLLFRSEPLCYLILGYRQGLVYNLIKWTDQSACITCAGQRRMEEARGAHSSGIIRCALVRYDAQMLNEPFPIAAVAHQQVLVHAQ
jgi:hypothetical protein